MADLTPADQDQRQRALDAEKSFIVQAPAGSGKTRILVCRFLTLLARVSEPEEIVAITFTRKATAEMQRKILDALSVAQDAADSGKDCDDEVHVLAVQALHNSQQRNWQLLENPRRLRVMSIDAFALELVRRMPWSSRFGGVPQIVEGIVAQQLYAQAARRTLDHINRSSPWTTHNANLLELANADLARAENLLVAMLDKRDLWMRGIAQGEREYFEAMWQQVITGQLKRTCKLIPGPMQYEMIEMLGFAAGNITGNNNQAIADCLGVETFPNTSIESLPVWRGLTELLLTREGTPRKTVDKRVGFPPQDKAQKQQMLELLKVLNDHPQIVRDLQTIRALPGGKFSDLQWRTMESVLKLLPVAAAELRLLFTETNSADYSEISQRAEVALGDADNPSEVALYADYRISHILMDEVQDSSRAQFDLLANLIREWTPDDGRTLFLVGDPMQSIYRFREAEVGNFLHIQQQGIANIQPESLTLKSNFRSSKTLVEWFNEVMYPIFPPSDDVNNSAIAYAPSTATQPDDPDSGFILHTQWDGAFECEAIEVSKQVARERTKNPRHCIGILGRSRRHLRAIAKQLRGDDIPYQAIDLEPLSRRPAIVDLISLTRALIRISDRIAWLSILRAPWCGLDLKDLTRLTAGSDAGLIPQLVDNPDVLEGISPDGQRRLSRFAAVITPAMRQLDTLPLSKLVYGTWVALGGPGCIEPGDRLDCESYFELLAVLEDDHPLITAELLHQAAEQRWSKSPAQANVQLLTIHKAKGLEFDVVMLPMLNRGDRGDQHQVLRWIRLPEQLLVAPLPHSHEKDRSFYDYLGHLEKQRQSNEMCRLLYVACTRARHKLHLFTNLKTNTKGELANPAAGSMWALLEPHLDFEKNPQSQPEEDQQDLQIDPARPFLRLPVGFSRLSLPADIKSPGITAKSNTTSHADNIEFSWAGENARIVGIALHHILQFVTPRKWPLWKNTPSEQILLTGRGVLSAHGLDSERHPHVATNLINAIENIQSDSRADWIFCPEHEDIHIEWPLTANLDGQVRSIIIDRSFIDAQGVRWIVDFKSSEHQGENLDHFLDSEKDRYSEQMQGYTRIVRMIEDRPVKVGLYFPLHRGWREWHP